MGKGRHLTVGGPSKEEKVAQQIEAAERRLLKQEEKRKKLMEALDIVKSKDKQQMQKVQEREKVRQEVVAEFQDAANAFVNEQIALNDAKRQKEVQQEVEREVAQRMQ